MFFTHAQIRNGRIDSNQILHINSPKDVVIYLTWHRNRLRGFGGVGCENGPLPLTSNTAYCATAHTRDYLLLLVFHHSLSLSFQTWNLLFLQILPTAAFLYLLSELTTWFPRLLLLLLTYLLLLFSFSVLQFLSSPCGRLCWLMSAFERTLK